MSPSEPGLLEGLQEVLASVKQNRKSKTSKRSPGKAGNQPKSRTTRRGTPRRRQHARNNQVPLPKSPVTAARPKVERTTKTRARMTPPR